LNKGGVGGGGGSGGVLAIDSLVCCSLPIAAVFVVAAVALDERTVLLSYYLSASADGRISTYILVMTSEEIRVFVITQDFPDSLVSMHPMSDEDRRVLMSPVALLIHDLRQELEAETGPLPVSLKPVILWLVIFEDILAIL
jgi:hypothetical protein